MGHLLFRRDVSFALVFHLQSRAESCTADHRLSSARGCCLLVDVVEQVELVLLQPSLPSQSRGASGLGPG